MSKKAMVVSQGERRAKYNGTSEVGMWISEPSSNDLFQKRKSDDFR